MAALKKLTAIVIPATILIVGVSGCGRSTAAGNTLCDAFANGVTRSNCSDAVSRAFLALQYPTPHSTAVTDPRLLSGGLMSLREFEDDVLEGRSKSNSAVGDRSRKRWVFLFSGTSYPILSGGGSTVGIPNQYDYVLVAVTASTLDVASQIYIAEHSLDQFGLTALKYG